MVVVLLFALAASGCKTEKDPDQPTILGIPPATACGGEDILDYTLTNAPSWLALEDTSNKARQGVIMRGVPGLSGGTRGLTLPTRPVFVKVLLGRTSLPWAVAVIRCWKIFPI